MNGHTTTTHRYAIIDGVFHPFAWSCTCGAIEGAPHVMLAEGSAFAHKLAQTREAKTVVQL